MKDKRYEVGNEADKDRLIRIAEMVHDELPETHGFTLFVFAYSNEPGADLFYISSAEREDMIRTVREWLRKQGH